MRCRLLAALGVLVFCLQAIADTPTTAPTQTGEVDLTFTQRSPLSTPKEIARRLNAKEHDLASDYDLSKFPFKVYVPKNYDPAVPHGVIVYIDNGQTSFARPKLETIIRKYPNDPAAVTAKQLLDQLPPE